MVKLKYVLNNCYGGWGLSQAAHAYIQHLKQNPDIAQAVLPQQTEFNLYTNPYYIAAVEQLGSTVASPRYAQLIVYVIEYDPALFSEALVNQHIVHSEYDGVESCKFDSARCLDTLLEEKHFQTLDQVYITREQLKKMRVVWQMNTPQETELGKQFRDRIATAVVAEVPGATAEQAVEADSSLLS